MAWLNKNKEKEELPPPDERPPDIPHLVKHVHRRDLVKLMDKIWKPYKYESDEFKVEVQQCQKFMDLVYTIYRKYGTREQRDLLDDSFSDDKEHGLPRNDDQRSDWVRTVGSKIFREPLLRDELKLSVRGRNPREICAARCKPSRLTCTTANADLHHQARLGEGLGG